MFLALSFFILSYGGISYCQVNDSGTYSKSEESIHNNNAEIAQNANPENLTSMSLDGAALNQMLPAKNDNSKNEKNNDKGRNHKNKQKKTSKQNRKKNPQKTKKDTNNGENTTIIPKMRKINWLYDITNENDAANNQKDNQSVFEQPPEKEKKHKKEPWHDECGRPICTLSEWIKDKSIIREHWRRSCCQIFIFEDGKIKDWDNE